MFLKNWKTTLAGLVVVANYIFGQLGWQSETTPELINTVAILWAFLFTKDLDRR